MKQINQSAQLSSFVLSIQKSGRPARDTRPTKRIVSQVVFFSNLPRGNEKKPELLTIARRFGTVEKQLFLNDKVWYIFCETCFLCFLCFS